MHTAMPAFGGLLIVVAVAFAAPLALGLAPRLRLPAVVLEIAPGIAGGPRRGVLAHARRGARAPARRSASDGAVVLLVAFAAAAQRLGLETILGAFMAGAILSLLDRDEAMTHPEFRRKLEAIGFGVFIPVFFVTSGVRFDLDALLGNLGMVPLFLGALLLARGLPALLYGSTARRRRPPRCSRPPRSPSSSLRRRSAPTSVCWTRRRPPPWSAPACCPSYSSRSRASAALRARPVATMAR